MPSPFHDWPDSCTGAVKKTEDEWEQATSNSKDITEAARTQLLSEFIKDQTPQGAVSTSQLEQCHEDRMKQNPTVKPFHANPLLKQEADSTPPSP